MARCKLVWIFFCCLCAHLSADNAPLPKLPNPAHLETGWREYFAGEESSVRPSFTAFQEKMGEKLLEIESESLRRRAEQLLAEISVRFESFQHLRERTIDQAPYVWLPQESYSLEKYLKVVEALRALEHKLDYLSSESQRLDYLLDEMRSDVADRLVEYGGLREVSLEKFLLGLDILSRHLRVRNLSEEQRLIKLVYAQNEADRGLLDEQIESMSVRLIPDSIEKLKEQERTLRAKHAHAHTQLLETQSEATRAYVEDELIGEALRQKALELTALMLKESITRAELVENSLRTLYQQSFAAHDPAVMTKALEPHLIFIEGMHNQLQSWEKAVVEAIDQLGHVLATEPDDEADADRQQILKRNIRVALSSKVSVDEMSKVLNRLNVMTELIESQNVREATMGAKLLYSVGQVFSGASEFFSDWLYRSLFQLGGVPVTLASLLQALCIFAVAMLCSRAVRKGVRRLARKRGTFDESAVYTFELVFHYAVLMLGGLFALASIGLTLNNLALVVGALGIGIGFGLQNIVNNFLSGLSILFARNVKVGDYVEVQSGHIGKVTEINVLKTTIHTFDGTDVLVPNSEIMGTSLVNWTKHDSYHRLHVPFCVAYGTEHQFVQKVVIEAAHCVSSTVVGIKGIPGPEVWLCDFADSSLNFELVVWVNLRRSRGRSALRAAYLTAIESAFKRNEISIPFPQRDLHVKTLPSDWK